MTIEILKTVLKKITIGIASIFVYLPIIGGILAPVRFMKKIFLTKVNV